MDGKALTQVFLEAVDEVSVDMVNVDLRSVYEHLDIAAIAFVRELGQLSASAAITTVEGQQDYDLPPDFIRLQVKNRKAQFIAKYSDGSNTYWPVLENYDDLYRRNLSDSKSAPGTFAVVGKATAASLVTGVTTAAGAVAAGEAILTASAATFSTSVHARDRVYNNTGQGAGIVLAVTDTTHLKCALFPEGLDSWGSGDAYTIQPAAIRQIHLDAPSLTAGHTLTVPYVAMPAPVYSEHGFWRIDPKSCFAIAHEAAYFYMMNRPKKKPNRFHHDLFLQEVRQVKVDIAVETLGSRQYRPDNKEIYRWGLY